MTARSVISYSSRVRVIAPLAALAGIAAHRLPALAQATPAAGVDPGEMLARTISAMGALTTYHFKLETEYGGVTVVPELLSVYGLEGDVERPGALHATGDAMIVVLPISFEIVSIDGNTWITNPLGLAGLGGGLVNIGDLGAMISFDPALAVNPDHVALPLLGIIQNPQHDVAGSNDAEYKIDGIIPRASLASVESSFDGATVFASLDDGGDDLTASVWVGLDDRITRLDISGKLLSNEFDSLVRHYNFSSYDEPVMIDHP